MILSPHTWHHLCQSHRALVLTLVFRTRWGVLWATLLSFFSLSFFFSFSGAGDWAQSLAHPPSQLLKNIYITKTKKTDTHRIGLELTIMGKHTYRVLPQRSFSLAVPVWASRSHTYNLCVLKNALSVGKAKAQTKSNPPSGPPWGTALLKWGLPTKGWNLLTSATEPEHFWIPEASRVSGNGVEALPFAEQDSEA